MATRFEPKFITVLREGYSTKKFSQDLMAGIVVGIVALPLAIAFGIASGVRPEQGIYTAIVAGFLISFFSGSRVQIGGPTGAFIVIIYDIVHKHGYEGLAVATLMAGVMLVLMGLAHFGEVIRYIPYPVTIGFTAGIALIILSGQIRDLFGLQMTSVPSEFLEKCTAYGEHFHSFNGYAIALGLATILIILYWPKINKRIPGSLVAILLTTAAVSLLHFPVETIGSRFGSVPNTLPFPQFPVLTLELMKKMLLPAFSIALLAGIESLLSAVVADGMTGRKHRSDMELVAQGIANIVSPFFLGIPATGAIARTATNVKNGGKTPFAGIVHAFTLLLILLFFGKWAALIPMATLAGILVIVSYNMSEWHLFKKLLQGPKSDILVLLSTFFLTVVIDLVVAIQVGVVLAALLFMKRMADLTQVGHFKQMLQYEEELKDPLSLRHREVPEGVEIFEVYGAFFFGAADKFQSTLSQIQVKPKVLILRLRHVTMMDATGLHALEDVVKQSKKENVPLILSGVHGQPQNVIEHSEIVHQLDPANICSHIDEALARAREILGLPPSPAPDTSRYMINPQKTA